MDRHAHKGLAMTSAHANYYPEATTAKRPPIKAVFADKEYFTYIGLAKTFTLYRLLW